MISPSVWEGNFSVCDGVSGKDGWIPGAQPGQPHREDCGFSFTDCRIFAFDILSLNEAFHSLIRLTVKTCTACRRFTQKLYLITFSCDREQHPYEEVYIFTAGI